MTNAMRLLVEAVKSHITAQSWGAVMKYDDEELADLIFIDSYSVKKAIEKITRQYEYLTHDADKGLDRKTGMTPEDMAKRARLAHVRKLFDL